MSVDPVQNGGTSQVSLNSEIIALALGGSGGQNIAGAFASGSGGIAPQAGNVGDVVFYGGKGAPANSNGTGGGGGSAGEKGKGGDAPVPSTGSIALGGVAGANGGAEGGKGHNTTNVCIAGGVPGAGGSGGAVRATSNSFMKGGDGANGKIILSFKLLVTGLSTIQSNSNKTIDIYPNPATDKLNLNAIGHRINKIQLVDLTVKVVLINNEVIKNECIDLSVLLKGLYFIKIFTSDGIYTAKVIKN
jgi:hypothetical protein